MTQATRSLEWNQSHFVGFVTLGARQGSIMTYQTAAPDGCPRPPATSHLAPLFLRCTDYRRSAAYKRQASVLNS